MNVIVGLGATGLSCAKLFLRENIPFAIVDTREAPPLREAFLALQSGAPYAFGNIPCEWMNDAKEIIVSPGLALSHPLLRNLRSCHPRESAHCHPRESGDPLLLNMDPRCSKDDNSKGNIIGDIELFARRVQAPVIAITGTNGKSTVTALVGQMCLEAGKKTLVGGNIGTPVLDLLEEPVPDVYVLELSSAQLCVTRSLKPLTSVVLNITEDHLDWHGSFEAYVQAKCQLYTWTEKPVINVDDAVLLSYCHSHQRCHSRESGNPLDIHGWIPAFAGMTSNQRCHSRESGNPLDIHGWTPAFAGMTDKLFKCRDGHNIFLGDNLVLNIEDCYYKGACFGENAVAALSLGQAFGLPLTSMINTLKHFQGLPHRTQLIYHKNGIRWYNDSKATNIMSMAAAIVSLQRGSTGRMILILGGSDKGADFKVLTQYMNPRISTVIALGETRFAIAGALKNTTPVVLVESLKEAVNTATTLATPGDIVLLSPACASLDMFRNFAHRGECFTQLVKEIA